MNMFEFYRERKDDLDYRTSRRATIKKWWYDVSTIFDLSFEVGLYGILFQISIFESLNFKMNFNFLQYSINLPDEIRNILSWDKSWSLTKHEALEIEMSPNYNLTLGVSFFNSMHTAHAGITIEIKLLFFEFFIRLSNDYHWDGVKNKRQPSTNANDIKYKREDHSSLLYFFMLDHSKSKRHFIELYVFGHPPLISPKCLISSSSNGKSV
jgi:hypothetical protein